MATVITEFPPPPKQNAGPAQWEQWFEMLHKTIVGLSGATPSAESATNLEEDFIADTAIGVRDVVYISSPGKVSPALGLPGNQSKAIGFALSTVVAGANVTIRKAGNLSGFSGLSAGAVLYLSATLPGKLTSVRPTTTTGRIVQLGVTRETTFITINVEQLTGLS